METDNQEVINQDLQKLKETFEEAIKPVAETLRIIFDNILQVFNNSWENVKKYISIFEDMKISRKRFIKLLMSIGYQRNEANKIAWSYHSRNGKYTMCDYLIERGKKEDSKKCG